MGSKLFYSRDTSIGNAQYFNLSFVRRDPDTKQIIESFQTNPNVLRKQEKGTDKYKFLASNPSTKHYLHKDIFTLAVPSWVFETEDTSSWKSRKVSIGDTLYTKRAYITVAGQEPLLPDVEGYTFTPGDISVALVLKVHYLNDEKPEVVKPVFYILKNDNKVNFVEEVRKDLGLSFRFTRILPKEAKYILDKLKKLCPRRSMSLYKYGISRN